MEGKKFRKGERITLRIFFKQTFYLKIVDIKWKLIRQICGKLVLWTLLCKQFIEPTIKASGKI